MCAAMTGDTVAVSSSATTSASASATASSGLRTGSDALRMFVAGGVAGAIARTASAPFDRLKLLFQVQAVPGSGTGGAGAYTGLHQAITKVFREEGMLSFWKGNGVNIIRIFPYSAAQLSTHDTYKRMLAQQDGVLSVPGRLAAGAAAGMTATALTHPLDTLRLRLALPHHPYKGIANAVLVIGRTEGLLALYKGLGPTLVGIAPFAAINFSSYDLLKRWAYEENRPQTAAANLLLGAAAGSLAATVCYPLDTIRRRMQMKGDLYRSQAHAFVQIWRHEGLMGFYRGWMPNILKIAPQNSIRFVAYEALKSALGVKKVRTDT